MPPIILIASATATTAASAVEALSAAGIAVRAFVRKADDPRALHLARQPGVELFAGDLGNPEHVAAALSGVSRAMLVSGAFSHDQFETETLFIEAAARAGLEITVRVSTASGLILPGTKGAYGRAHHGIQSFVAAGGYMVVDLNPDGVRRPPPACPPSFLSFLLTNPVPPSPPPPPLSPPFFSFFPTGLAPLAK